MSVVKHTALEIPICAMQWTGENNCLIEEANRKYSLCCTDIYQFQDDLILIHFLQYGECLRTTVPKGHWIVWEPDDPMYWRTMDNERFQKWRDKKERETYTFQDIPAH